MNLNNFKLQKSVEFLIPTKYSSKRCFQVFLGQLQLRHSFSDLGSVSDLKQPSFGIT